MIVSFSVSNFRSFSSEETFSLVASNRLSGDHDNHALPIPNSEYKVLRVGVIYGANGAGKSNLFKALQYLRNIAVRPAEMRGTGREAFRLSESLTQPSVFDLQFIVAEKLYRFGFEADDHRITREWLAVVTGERERIIYERTTDDTGKVTVDAPELKGSSPKLAALAVVGGPQNQSFLATVRVTLDKSDYGEDLGPVIRWFDQGLGLIEPSAPFNRLGRHFYDDRGSAEFASNFLRTVSTGVDHLEVTKTEITAAEVPGLIPQLRQGEDLVRDSIGDDRWFRHTIRAAHKTQSGTTVPFDLSDESDGTKRLLNLLPALHDLHANDRVYFIDEIDRSLHPNLVWEFVNFFLRSAETRQAQVIFTTHQSNLLDLALLRRDEIWFAEKDHTHSTRLYSLTDFNVRKDLEIRKHYLNGRFGAVPYFGDLEQLSAEAAQK